MARPVLDKDGLSGQQRDTLTLVLKLEAEGVEISAPSLSARIGCTRHSAQHRLRMLALKGWIRKVREATSRPDGGGHATFATCARPDRRKQEPVTTVRPDGVRFTKCPPAYAQGALYWGSSLGARARLSASLD